MQKRLLQAGVACTAQQKLGSQTEEARQQTQTEAATQQRMQHPSQQLQGSQQEETRQMTRPETAEEHAVIDRLVAESLQHGLLHRQEASDNLQQKAAADAAWHQQSNGVGPDRSVPASLAQMPTVESAAEMLAAGTSCEEARSRDDCSRTEHSAAADQRHKSLLHQYVAGKVSRHSVLVNLARIKVSQQSTL